MVIMSALLLLGISCVGGTALWAGFAAFESRKRKRYLRWRSQWRLIKGDADGYREQD